MAVIVNRGGSVSGDFKDQSRPTDPYDAMRFFVPTEKPGTRSMSITVDNARGNRATHILPFSVTAPVTYGVGSVAGSYNGKVTGTREPDKNVYSAHVVSRNSDGTYTIALLYGRTAPYHITLKPNRSLTLHGDRFRGDVDESGSMGGNGGIGTAITMQWTPTGSDGMPTPYTWMLTKYSNQDLAAPPPGHVLHSH